MILSQYLRLTSVLPELFGDKRLKNNLLCKDGPMLRYVQPTCLKLYSTASQYDKPSFDIEQRD